MGHTHQPDKRSAANGGRYYNPGSWTRDVDLDKNPNLTLDDLKNETVFPYQLNFFRVERDASNNLVSDMFTYGEG